MEPYNIHTLANGATICVISCSDLKFSDGTRSKGQSQKFCDQFKFRKEFCGKDIIIFPSLLVFFLGLLIMVLGN